MSAEKRPEIERIPTTADISRAVNYRFQKTGNLEFTSLGFAIIKKPSGAIGTIETKELDQSSGTQIESRPDVSLKPNDLSRPT